MNNADEASSAISKLTIAGDDSTAQSVKLIGMVELISIMGEDSVDFVQDCIEFATNLTHEDIEDLDPDVGVDILMDIYEVNKGFFTKCLNKLKEVMKTDEKKEVTKKKQK